VARISIVGEHDADEQGKNRDWIERAVAHGEQDGVRLRITMRITSSAQNHDAEVADYLDELRDLYPNWRRR